MRRLLLVLIVCGVAWGQQTQTIYQQLFSNIAAPATSVNVNSIGQQGHQVFVQTSNAPSHTCNNSTSVAFAGTLQFSYDNSTFTDFGVNDGGATTPNSGVPWTKLYFGAGGFPFVRFKITAFDTTNCLVSVWYTGTIPSNLTQTQGIALNGAPGPVNPTVIGGVSGLIAGHNGLQTQNIVTSLPVCVNSVLATVSSGTTGQLLGLGSVTGDMFVCSIIITMDGAGTFQISTPNLNGTCAGTKSNLTPAFTLATGIPLTLGGNIGAALVKQVVSGSLNATLCGTAGTSNAQVFITYALI